jgi:hypothetical protein
MLRDSRPVVLNLLALSYQHLPELIEARQRYERGWLIVGAIAILGWILVYLLHRRKTERLRSPPAWITVASVVGAFAGYWVWSNLWTWGDIGVGSRWIGELAVCVFGAIGWCIVVGWFIARSARPDNSQSAQSQ